MEKKSIFSAKPFVYAGTVNITLCIDSIYVLNVNSYVNESKMSDWYSLPWMTLESVEERQIHQILSGILSPLI